MQKGKTKQSQHSPVHELIKLLANFPKLNLTSSKAVASKEAKAQPISKTRAAVLDSLFSGSMAIMMVDTIGIITSPVIKIPFCKIPFFFFIYSRFN